MFPIRDTQPSYSKPIVTVFLIVINVLVFLFEFSLGPYEQNAFIAAYGLTPDRFHFVNVLTSMFLHGGWMHVLGNMWFLWIFGDNIEDILGHGKYLIFYLLCGIAAGLTQTMLSPDSRVPMVGASGAIAGVMGAYLVLYPRARVLTWFFFVVILPFPAWLWLVIWGAGQLLSGTASAISGVPQAGGIAVWAHVGGFVVGILLIKLFPQRRNRYRYGTW
jgi:membrane associated rhomboid family serine protease